MATQALDITGIQSVVKLINRDLIEIASLATAEVFSQLGWNVLTGVQNKDSKFIYNGNEAIASQYHVGKVINATLGKVEERELEVKNVASRILDNIQAYREKEPFDIIGVSDSGLLTTPHSQWLIMQIAKRFANQIMRNLVHGDYSKGAGDAYGLFNGLNALIAKDVTAGNIATGNDNLQILGTIDLTTVSDAAKVAAYEAFDKFILNMDEDLADAEGLNIMMSTKMYQYITQGAALKFTSPVQQLIMQNNDGVHFFDRQNINLKPTKLMGKGAEMVAYLNNGIDYASDLANIGDPSSAFVTVNQLIEDPNVLSYFIQVAVGMRINTVQSNAFCVGLTAANTYNTAKTLNGTVTVADDEETRLAALEGA